MSPPTLWSGDGEESDPQTDCLCFRAGLWAGQADATRPAGAPPALPGPARPSRPQPAPAQQAAAAAAGALSATAAHVRLHLLPPSMGLGPASPTDDPQDSQAGGLRGAAQLPRDQHLALLSTPPQPRLARSGTPGLAEPPERDPLSHRAPSCRLASGTWGPGTQAAGQASETSRRPCPPMSRPRPTLQRQEAAQQRGDPGRVAAAVLQGRRGRACQRRGNHECTQTGSDGQEGGSTLRHTCDSERRPPLCTPLCSSIKQR